MLALSAALLLAAASGSDTVDVIKTTDGVMHPGRMVEETPQGYVLEVNGKRELFEYSRVEDIRNNVRLSTLRPVTPVDSARLTLEKKLDRLQREREHTTFYQPLGWAVVGVLSPGIMLIARAPYQLYALPVIALLVSAIEVIVISIQRGQLDAEIARTKKEIEALPAEPASQPAPVMIPAR